ncbi:MAG TPA: histidine kinase [Bryobacteraceae bacterium]|nr:histidine kinase [Bryobacteraceae bacterium]
MLSPSARLLSGVLFTLLVIASYASYSVASVRRMRQVQIDVIEQNRKAALQLIRIQSDLNALALAMRDMIDNLDGYPLTAWSGQLERIHGNLDDAIRLESALAGSHRDPAQTNYLLSSFSQFWLTVDQMNRFTQSGEDAKARDLVRQTLLPRQEALSALASRLLVQNNEAGQRAAAEIVATYDGIERNAYWFLALSVAAVLAVSGMLIRSNRAWIDRISELASQRQELAQQLIATQESTLRAVSRDLHDEFGQILTAVGAMLKRAGRSAPDNFQEQLRETNVVVQESLEKIRALSQSLQPVILDEQGLGPAVQWYVSTFQRQTGLMVHYRASGALPELDAGKSVHIYRILQEALNNVARHAGVMEAWVRLEALPEGLLLAVEDRGRGEPSAFRPSVGLTGMRERAALLGGTLDIVRADPAGIRIVLTVPLSTLLSGENNA